VNVVDANHAQYVYKEKAKIVLSLTFKSCLPFPKTGKDCSLFSRPNWYTPSTSHAGEGLPPPPPPLVPGRSAYSLKGEEVVGPKSIAGTEAYMYFVALPIQVAGYKDDI
jgi:hypothetical protein